ncbi:hypothetical protein BHM03_00042565 [Ensete ventricosum]|nr:hypothetical protein BHM03_00042565 [Ensete ventricosum]
MMAGSARQGWKMAATSVAAIVKGGNNGVSGEGARDDTDRGREHWRRRREEGSEDIIDGEQRHQGSLMREAGEATIEEGATTADEGVVGGVVAGSRRLEMATLGKDGV